MTCITNLKHAIRVERMSILCYSTYQIKKEPHIPMRDFIEKFNKLVNRIPTASRSTFDKQKMFFIRSMSPNINFQINHAHVANFLATHTLEIKLEDDLIIARKWKREV